MKSSKLDNWKAPNQNLLPDFIIGGAMKSGTSTLHSILNEHPKIFIPKDEIHFFDIDNIIEHSDFNYYNKQEDKWTYQSMDNDPDVMWNWYQKRFEGQENQIKGEDSTSYLASRIAAERISLQDKKIKMIFILRHPTKRAYSNYYHMLKSGRAAYSFEDTIRFDSDSILNRSLYKQQLELCYKYIPADRIKIVIFEDFVKDSKCSIKEICSFLEIDFNDFPDNVFDQHVNMAKLPRNINLQIIKNKLLRNYGNSHYNKVLPFKPSKSTNANSFFARLMKNIHEMINPLAEKHTPKISDGSEAFLDDYFCKELDGIDELTGMDILSKWFKLQK